MAAIILFEPAVSFLPSQMTDPLMLRIGSGTSELP